MNPPVDPTVLDLLRGSALAPMIDRPVNDILKDMGLPQLPDLSALPPLPGLPPLPVIDLSAIARPLTDMASSFGTGQLGAPAPAPVGAPGAPAPAAAPDPTQVLTGISTALQTAMTMGTTALQAVMAIWQGMGAAEAAKKSGEATANGAELATQNAQEKAGLAAGATSVGVGGALMAAVIAKYMASVAASAPFLAAPGGQAFLVAATVSAITEALAVITKTRIEMSAHSANMTVAGKKVPITNAPKGTDSSQQMQQMMQMMQMLTPLMTMAGQGVQSMTQLAAANTALLAPKPVVEDPLKKEGDGEGADKEGLGVGSGSGSGGVGVGGVGGVGAAAQQPQLNPYSGTRTAGLPGGTGPSGVGNTVSATEPAAMRPGAMAGSPGGMMPMGAGAAGAAGARPAGDGSDMPGFLVNASHGDEVVGQIEGVSLPVVGAAEQVSEAPPDKDLTL